MQSDNKDTPFLSIIIPYFNTPIEYLRRVYESINCTDENLAEIIIVDDGSETDNAEAVDREFGSYPNTIILHKENGGMSSARNCGIKAARGEYIAFSDDDDQVTKDFVQDAYKYCREGDYDIVIGNIVFLPNGDNALLPGEKQSFDSSNMDELFRCMIDVKPRKYEFKVNQSQCGKVYRSEYVKRVMFDESVSLLEDGLFNRKIFDVVEKVLVVPEIWYYYYQREGSTIHPKDSEQLFIRRKTYLKALYELIKASSGERRLMYNCEAFAHFDHYGHVLAMREDIDRNGKIDRLKEYSDLPAIKESISELKLTSKYLNRKKRVLLFLLKNRIFGGYLLLKAMAAKH